MVNESAFKQASQTTVAAVAGALASVFFAKWIDMFPILISTILIIVYTLLIFGILYFFFKPDS